ncbi:hypothetical protein MTP06_35710 [Streptomyces sp. PLM4]|nr:hypothetical protein MTP06_35710 [Streptomyces sp. PLM4]
MPPAGLGPWSGGAGGGVASGAGRAVLGPVRLRVPVQDGLKRRPGLEGAAGAGSPRAVSYFFDTIGRMVEGEYGIGEGPATRVSLSLPEGTAEAIRARVGKREFSAFVAAAVERELRGQILDEYLTDYERRHGPLPARLQAEARQVFDDVFSQDAALREDEGKQWPAAS